MLVLPSGCHWFRTTPPAEDAYSKQLADPPTAEVLVKYINDNAQQLQMVKSLSMDIDLKQGSDNAPGISASMFCEKPRNFRLKGKVAGRPAVDVGSNEQELWFWAKNIDPPGVYYCSYTDLSSGKVQRMPFPIQPEWILEVLGMGTMDPNKNYQLTTAENRFQLNETTTTPQGQAVIKATIFHRGQAGPKVPQVPAHYLMDANTGKEICAAFVSEVRRDRSTNGAEVPTKILFRWAAQEKIEMKMTLNEVMVNEPLGAEQLETLFTRRSLRDFPQVNLAQATTTPTGRIEQAGGYKR
jgi:hypothetical protein